VRRDGSIPHISATAMRQAAIDSALGTLERDVDREAEPQARLRRPASASLLPRRPQMMEDVEVALIGAGEMVGEDALRATGRAPTYSYSAVASSDVRAYALDVTLFGRLPPKLQSLVASAAAELRAWHTDRRAYLYAHQLAPTPQELTPNVTAARGLAGARPLGAGSLGGGFRVTASSPPAAPFVTLRGGGGGGAPSPVAAAAASSSPAVAVSSAMAAADELEYSMTAAYSESRRVAMEVRSGATPAAISLKQFTVLW